MAKGSSGFDSGGNGKAAKTDHFGKISLDGKTGTEKQKAYAEDLLESARNTAKANGVAGYHETDKPNIKRYVDPDTADSFVGAYRMIRNGVEIQKTYGDVISFLKSNSVLNTANDIKKGAQRSGKSVNAFVEEIFKKYKK